MDRTDESEAREETPAMKATPLPMRYVVPLLLILLTEGVCGTMLLPFVGLFVAHLRGDSVEDAGYSSGILIGVFMLGQVVSGKFWGNISDTYGRKIPLASGLLAGAIIIVFFGMSPNIYVCYLLRFLHGCSNGNTLVAKSIIADITDKSNEAKGFALVSITWSLGSLFGPAIGGFLYDPAANPKTQWMHVSDDSFLGLNPAFLPSVIVGVYTAAAFLCCVFLLPETNRERKPLSTLPLVGRYLSCLDDRGSDSASAATADVVITDAADDSVPKHRAEQCAGEKPPSQQQQREVDPGVAPPRRRKLSYKQAYHIAPIRNVTLFYVLLAISDMSYAEILPLWGVASKASGGMGLFSDGVAILNLSYSIPAVLANMGFSKMCDIMRSFLRFWRLGAVIGLVATGLVPTGSEFDGGYYFVLVLGIVRQVGISWCYSLIHLLTAKSAPPGCVGSVYGISQSCASMARCIVPFIATPLFAWSLKEGHTFPFNHYLLFLIAVVPLIATYFLTYSLQLLPSDSDNVDEQLALEDWNGSERSADPGHQTAVNDADTDRDAPSTYMSLAASFATNPLADTFLNFDQMEAQNARERAQQGYGGGGTGDGSISATHTAPVTDPIATLLAHMKEDRRVGDVDEEAHPDIR